ncbi:unnamed protein product [Pedinophyceae sp. YPF-701]|nr:unnamed protein product [Pedinophyceae sp. YPF-701]
MDTQLGGRRPCGAGGAVPVLDSELAREYLPIFYFHPKEPFAPLEVEKFLQNCALYSPQGGLLAEDASDVHNVLQPGAAGVVRLRKGATYPTGDWTRPVIYYHVDRDHRHCAPARPKKEGGPLVTSKRWLSVVYMLFYSYNPHGLFGLGDHIGDLEHVRLLINPDTAQVEWVFTSAHSHEGQYRPFAAHRPPASEAAAEALKDTRGPPIYVACGSHAHYEREGVVRRIFGAGNDRCSGEGTCATPGNAALFDVRERPWYGIHVTVRPRGPELPGAPWWMLACPERQDRAKRLMLKRLAPCCFSNEALSSHSHWGQVDWDARGGYCYRKHEEDLLGAPASPGRRV